MGEKAIDKLHRALYIVADSGNIRYSIDILAILCNL
jgi:hypothetical protein